jgi:hypothetical protein
VTPVVIDVSAGVELVADTGRGRSLRRLLPGDTVPWVPDLFFAECGAVLRQSDLNDILPPEQIAEGPLANSWRGRYGWLRSEGCSWMAGDCERI